MFSCFIANAQKSKKIDLVNANSLEFDKSMGEDIKRLIGDVILSHEGTTLYCDSAYLYSNNTVDAYGRVRINSSSVRISGSVLHYDGDTKTAVLSKDVRMSDGEMTLVTEHLNFDTKSNVGSYTTGGKITTGSNVLTSTYGTYYSGGKYFSFKKNVVLVNPQYTMNSDTLVYDTETEVSHFLGPTTIVSKENYIYCENGWYDSKRDIAQFNENAYFTNSEQRLSGDSLYYNRNLGFGKAFNNITVTDTVQNIILKGDYAEYHEKEGSTMITQKAQLIQDVDGDSLFLHADTLRAVFDSLKNGKTLFAFNHARFYKSDIQGLADSIVYSFKDSLISMYTNPALWTSNNQLTGDTILIQLKNNRISKMFLYSSSFIISEEDSIRYNQVKGKDLVGHFYNNELRKIDVHGNGETIYYVKDELQKLIGINVAMANDLMIFVVNDDIYSISFITKPEAILYPEKDFPEEQSRLKNFRWLKASRPYSKESIFN